MPAPFLVKDVGLDITPDIVPVPAAPSSVNAKAPAIAPLQVNVPELVAVIVLADPKVMFPLYEAAIPVFVKAPAGVAVNPVPFNVNGRAVDNVVPFKSNTDPELTVVAEEVPNAVVFANFKVPALINVDPP